MPDYLTVLVIILAIVVVSLWLEKRSRILRKLGSASLVILIGLILSNVGILPGDSPVYDFFTHHGVLAGVVLVLLNVNLGSLRQAGGPMLKAFVIGAVGTMIGSAVMGMWLYSRIGEETYKLAGQYAATYIGGGMNFAAVGRALGTSSDLFTAGVAADVIVTAFWLIACMVVPEFFGKKGGESSSEASAAAEKGEGGGFSLAQLLFHSGKPINMLDLALLGAIAVGVMWASEMLATLVPAVPMIIWLTTLVLALAQLKIVSAIPGSSVIGNYLILVFLACNGARSVVARIVEVGPAIFYFAAGTVLIHGIIIFAIGYAMKVEMRVLAVASQANIGGSASAMALASARGMPDLILSGVAVGMLGNALGNYCGLFIGGLLQG